MTQKQKKFSGALPKTDSETWTALATTQFTTALEYRGFDKALDRVPHGEYNKVIAELHKALAINSRSGLHAYRHGKVRLRADQAAKVQEVFKRRGIEQPWDA